MGIQRNSTRRFGTAPPTWSTRRAKRSLVAPWDLSLPNWRWFRVTTLQSALSGNTPFTLWRVPRSAMASALLLACMPCDLEFFAAWALELTLYGSSSTQCRKIPHHLGSGVEKPAIIIQKWLGQILRQSHRRTLVIKKLIIYNKM